MNGKQKRHMELWIENLRTQMDLAPNETEKAFCKLQIALLEDVLQTLTDLEMYQ